MLILPEHLAYPTKNSKWVDRTPNEEFRDNPAYAIMVEQWAKKNKIPSWRILFEVRIIYTKSILDIHQSNRWWDDPLFMDHIFWVYQKPITFKNISGNKPYQVYALEYYECLRVVDIAKNKFGYNPFPSEAPSLCIPVDCVELCWDETQAGYSKHIRQREEKKLSNKVLDKEEADKEEVNKLLTEIVDVSNDARWQKNDRVYQGNINGKPSR